MAPASKSLIPCLYSPDLPTTAQYELMCAPTACQEMIAEVITLKPPACDLTEPTGD
ncbi:Highly acidic elicitin 26 [Phytophthora capsici]|nr:Highly acidic elicitin 26 [Phytophthora capsici]